MRKIILEKESKAPNERKECISWNFPDDYFKYSKQREIVNKLYLEQDINHKKDVVSQLTKKITSYKQQDIEKNLIDDNYRIISLPELIEKLVESKLYCCYCRHKVTILYKSVREMKQWTLDRIDNDYGHTNENVLIACLDCNVRRRRLDMEKFKFTKQLKIIKSQ